MVLLISEAKFFNRSMYNMKRYKLLKNKEKDEKGGANETACREVHFVGNLGNSSQELLKVCKLPISANMIGKFFLLSSTIYQNLSTHILFLFIIPL